MKNPQSKYVWLLFLVLVTGTAGAQNADAPEALMDLEEVRKLRVQAEENASLAEDLRARILGLYDEAIGSLESAAVNRAARAATEREREEVQRLSEALRVELRRPEQIPKLGLPRDPTIVQAEDALARERARLAGNRSALRRAEQRAEDRATARSDASKRLGTLDQEIEQLSDDLRVVSQSDSHPEFKTAARTRILARREAVLSEMEKLRGSLKVLGDRGVLIPMEADQARRRVTYSEQLVAMLEEAALELRRRDAEDSLERVRALAAEASENVPELSDVASEVAELAELMWGADGVVGNTEAIAKSLLTNRKNVSDLDRISELTRRKFEAFGSRGSIVRWWPDIPDDFPKVQDLEDDISLLEQLIPEVEHQLITFEQQRSRTRTVAKEAWEALRAEQGEAFDADADQLVRGLFRERRLLLDRLIQHYGRYSNQLVEHRSVSVHLRDKLARVERFLYGNLLWARSVPRPIVPRFSDMANAVRWMTSVESRVSITGDAEVERGKPDLGDLLIVLLVVTTVVFRPRIRRRLETIAELVRNPDTDQFRFTLEALFHTLVLAAPLPVILWTASEIVGRTRGSIHLAAASEALFYLAGVAALLEWIRQHFTPNGLAEAHFNWPAKITRPIHRGLIWPELISLPLLYIALELAMAGIRLSSPQPLQAYNNSLGRVAFVVAILVLGVWILSMLRPERIDDDSAFDGVPIWKRKFSSYAFPAVFYYVYPIVLLGTILPAVLAIFGFYITGLLLAYQMLRTLGVVVGVLVLAGLLVRWRATSANRAALSEDDEALSIADEQEAEAADAQVRQLSRFAVILVAAMGIYTVWSEALPMLEVMKRIQIWPKIVVMERVGVRDLEMIGASAETTTAASTTEGESTSTPTVPGVPTTSTGGSVESTESSPLTLWSLFEALFAVIITVVLARNLPGLLEVILKRRTGLDSGARVAFSTLIRYSISIVGVTVVFSVLGVSWSKVQWLAAALTFGLGFGLQEIVADFVSGLILLVERPVRVGDVVTIGNLMGTVTQIQIRATTITLWDRSEMIVPNRDFVTTKLVNWTLSDSKRRIEIPLRIAYGANLEMVRETLVGAAAQHPDVLEDPAPHCLLLGFGEDAIKFELRFVVDFGKGLAAKDQVQMEIDRRFREIGIAFALPRSEIKVISDSG